MGVRGLQCFVEKYCPDGWIDVDIEALASEFQECTGKTPVLVVDAMGLLNKLYTCFMPWVFGGQWAEFLAEVQCFLDAFKKAGIDLVFIFDGVVENSKYPEWLKRRNAERERMSTMFQIIRDSETGRHPGPRSYHIPTGLGNFMRFSLKVLGATVYNTLSYGNGAVYQFYKTTGAFGVLGQDSDFLIYDIQNYFSLTTLRYKRKLEVKMYDRLRLCDELGLDPVHLVLVACLMGTDLIPQNQLFTFHCEITNTPAEKKRIPPYSQLVPAIAQFLSDWNIRDLTPEVVVALERHVFGERQRMYGLMDKVVRRYTCAAAVEDEMRCQINPKVFKILRDKHVNGDSSTSILEVLVTHSSMVGASIEDYNDQTMPTIGVVCRPIRKRVFGLILGVGVQDDQGKAVEPLGRSESSLVVGVNAIKEWCPSTHHSMTLKPEIVAAEPLIMPRGTPKMEDLWLTPNMLPLRYQAFLTCMHCRMDPELVSRLETCYVSMCLVLHYLLNEVTPRFLQESDVDAFLAQAVHLPRDPAEFTSLRVPRVDPRGVQLATLFMGGISQAIKANNVCNFPLESCDQMPWKFFDGKLFHSKYLMSREGKTIEELCDWNELSVREAKKMKKCIYSTQ